MKNFNRLLPFILFFSIFVNLEAAPAKNLTNVNSSHDENPTSNITYIEVQWNCASIVSGDTYYAAFSKDLTLTFSEYDPSDPELPSQSLNDPALEFPYSGDSTSYTATVDGIYYFNIVIDSDGEYGLTESIGPFIIDTTAPSLVSVTGVSDTETNSIELTLEAADATEYCILKNNTNTGSCSWNSIPANRVTQSPTLDEGTNTIYAFFRDSAGNMNQDFHEVTYTLIDEQTGEEEVVLFGVPTLNEWGMIIFMGFLMLYALKKIRLGF